MDAPVVRWRVRVVRGQAGVGVVQAGDGDPLRLVDLLLLVGEEGRIWKRERRVRSQFDMGENGRARARVHGMAISIKPVRRQTD